MAIEEIKLTKRGKLPTEYQPGMSILKSLNLPFLNAMEETSLTIKEWFEDIEMIEENPIESILFIDTETSHFNGFACSIACILTDINGIVLDKYYIEINPQIKMDPEAIAVHKITDAQVKDAPVFKDIRLDLESIFNKSDIVIAYNTIYDLGVLIREYQRLGIKIPENMLYAMDAMKALSLSIQTFNINGKKKPNPTLSECADYLKISTKEGALHNALFDTEILKEVFFKAKELDRK